MKLADFIQEQQIEGLRVWTSRMKRAIQTVADVPAPQERWKALNEIDAVGCLREINGSGALGLFRVLLLLFLREPARR